MAARGEREYPPPDELFGLVVTAWKQRETNSKYRMLAGMLMTWFDYRARPRTRAPGLDNVIPLFGPRRPER